LIIADEAILRDEQKTNLLKSRAMAQRPDRDKEEILRVEQLKQLRHNLAHLSQQHVQDFYERADQDCRVVDGRLPGRGKYRSSSKSETTMEVATLI
jgi:hypothetical protein